MNSVRRQNKSSSSSSSSFKSNSNNDKEDDTKESCGYDEDDDEKFYSYKRRKKSYQGEQLDLLLLPMLFVYLLLGSLMYSMLDYDNNYAFESSELLQYPSEQQQQQTLQNIDTLRTQSVQSMWQITNKLNILYEANWTKLIEQEMALFESKFIIASRRQFARQCHAHANSYSHANSQQNSIGGGKLRATTTTTTSGELSSGSILPFGINSAFATSSFIANRGSQILSPLDSFVESFVKSFASLATISK